MARDNQHKRARMLRLLDSAQPATPPAHLPQKELKEVERDKLSGVTVKVKGGNLQRLIGTLEGMGHGAITPPSHTHPSQAPRTRRTRAVFL